MGWQNRFSGVLRTKDTSGSSNTIEPTEINGIELKIMNKLGKEYDKIKNKLLLEIIKELELESSS